MTRLFLAAGVAAMAIAAPAAAKPGGGHGGDKGGQQAAAVQHGGGGGGQRVQSVERRGGGGGGGGGFAMQRAQRAERIAPQRMERTQRAFVQRAEHGQRFAAFQRGGEQGHGKANRVDRTTRINRIDRQQVRAAERQQVRVNRTERVNRLAERQQVRGNRELRLDKHAQRIDNRMAVGDQLRGNRALRVDRINERINQRLAGNAVRGYGVGGCPPGLMNKDCMPPGLNPNRAANRIFNEDAFRASRLASLALAPRTRVLDPFQAAGFIGAPLSTVNGVVPLMALPQNVAYLYPDTPDYYYRYGNGYLYGIDRDTSLIASLLPLLGGGLLPGQYLPASYMNSYVPDYYGLNSFYPASYGYNPGYGYNTGYGYNNGYGYNTCNRYANGVIYQVDCVTGMIIDVIPMYAGGYGVGQLLPSSYGYYNVPTQYRSLYYNTPDYNYWYAPGAIYQYDPGSSMITSVAALLSPGFTVGQQLPLGYSAYNVPYGYRDTYYDTPNAWYRYNNGNIYQVDPVTQLVTAIVASILT